MTPTHIAILFLISIPPLLLVLAWSSMKFRSIPPPEVNEEARRRLIQGAVAAMRILCLEIQKRKDEQ
jgi:hypothetical protein